MADFDAITDWAEAFLAKLTPAARATLARQIAASLKPSQQARIRANLNPDGTAYAPRKPQMRRQAGGIKRGAMFRKIGRALRTEATAEHAVVSFAGRVQRIARVHQFGERDTVRNKGRAGPEVQYPARELLGYTDAEKAMIEDVILTHLAG